MKQIIIDCQTGKKTTIEIEDIIFPPKTEEELTFEYHELVVSMVREKYTADDEIAILRKKLAEIDINDEFTPYNTYVEECKANAKQHVYGVIYNE